MADLSARAPAAKGKAKSGGKVAAKYRNASTGETWSGRGLRPNWLKAALAAGRKLEDFAL
jgi:DNA-binding protein H-NS